MTAPNWDQYASVARSVIIFSGGVLTTLGVLSATDMQTITGGLNDIGEGAKLIIKGVGAIIPVAAAAWGVYNSSLKSKVAAVNAAAPAALATAVAQVKPAEMIAAVDALPDVKGVVTQSTARGQALATSIPSPTVVSAGTTQAEAVAKKTV